LSQIYLIRHAQAGTRDNYDQLSDLGQKQAVLLGEYLAAQRICPDMVFTGSMHRQKQTAEIALAALSNAEKRADCTHTERWNEFSLASLYKAFVPRMLEESADFARDFAQMQDALRLDPHTTRGATGRCDAAIVRAWMTNRYPDYEGESWSAFRARIESHIPDLTNHGEDRTVEDRTVLVFTSATPIVVLTAATLGLTDEKLLSLLGVIYNSSVTVMRAYNGSLRLFTYNSVPHLPAGMITLR